MEVEYDIEVGDTIEIFIGNDITHKGILLQSISFKEELRESVWLKGKHIWAFIKGSHNNKETMFSIHKSRCVLVEKYDIMNYDMGGTEIVFHTPELVERIDRKTTNDVE